MFIYVFMKKKKILCCKAIFESDKSEQNMSAFQTDGTSAGKSADTFVSVKK